MNKSYLAPSMALASLLAAAFPAQAQTGMEAFNPMAMLAPIMTPLGAMMVPMTAPMNNSMNAFNPAMLNPTAMFNPGMFNFATMFNPAMLPVVPTIPGYGVPTGMVPFNGLQAMPQAYGMPPQMANPFAVMPQFPQPAPANQAVYPMFPGFPGFPMPFPGSR